LLKLSDTSHNFIGFVQPTSDTQKSLSEQEYEKYFLGNFDRLAEITEVYRIDEIIFCGKDISSQQIIDVMSQVKRHDLEFEIAPPESLFIIGSNSVEDPGELYVIDINNINKKVNKRNKRFIDLLLALFLLVTSPLMLFFQRNPMGFLLNIFKVLSGKISWVGYSQNHSSINLLPRIKPGVLSPIDALNNVPKDQLTTNRLNSLYAKDYKVYSDLQIILKGWRNLGRKPV